VQGEEEKRERRGDGNSLDHVFRTRRTGRANTEVGKKEEETKTLLEGRGGEVREGGKNGEGGKERIWKKTQLLIRQSPQKRTQKLQETRKEGRKSEEKGPRKTRRENLVAPRAKNTSTSKGITDCDKRQRK